ncbi:YhdP family protein [Nevskia sp.]|uniref:YhdP family protein n=1 Tax=Nevskia sp. TaxID=1929292 RepID=UPI0025DBC152|nr:YhdP family protein [Nevskia sp.]
MKRNRKRWWTRLVTVLAVFTVFAATLSVGFRLLVDSVPSYRIELERQVAKAVGHPTRVGSMALTWRGIRPTLELRGIALLDAAGVPLLEAERLRLGFSIWRLAFGPRVPSAIDALGVQLFASADADGTLHLRGFELKPGGHPSLTADLARLERIRLRDCRLTLTDARLADKTPLEFVLETGSLRHDGDRYVAEAVLRPPAALARRVDVSATVTGDLAQPERLAGRWRAEFTRIEGWPWLAQSLKPGTALSIDEGRLVLDGTVVEGRSTSVAMQLRVGRVAAARAQTPVAALADIVADAQFQPNDDGGWTLRVPNAAWTGTRGPWTSGELALQQMPGGARQLTAHRLRLDDLAPWLSTWRDLPKPLARLRDVQGDLENLLLTIAPRIADEGPQPVAVRASLVGVGVSGSDEEPGFAGLTGTVEATRDGGSIDLADAALELRLPKVFEVPVPISSLRGSVRWARRDDGWRIDSPALDMRLGGSEVGGELGVTLHDGQVPDLDLRLDLRSQDAAALKPYMPKTWGVNTRAWLTRALKEARVTSGELTIHAPMTPRDADNHPTIPWQLRLNVTGAALEFARDWPVAENLTAQLDFHDGGLDIAASDGTVSGARIERLRADIANFFEADLKLDGRIAGDAADFYRLFRDSPLRTRLSGLLARTEASGPASAELSLRVPLHIPQPPVEASGTVDVAGATMTVRGLAEPLRAVTGRLQFGKSISADKLTATLFDTPIEARIAPEPGAPDPILSGRLTVEPGRDDGLSAAFIPAWLRGGLSGSTAMTLRLPLGGPDNGRLSLASALRGVTSTLPRPLTKAADAALPVAIELAGDPAANATRLRITAGDELKVGLRMLPPADGGAAQTRGVEVRLGPGDMPQANGDGVVLIGAPAFLDLGAWIGFLGGTGSLGNPALRFASADVHAAQVGLRRWTLGPTHLVALPNGDGITVRATGAASGTVDWQPADSGRVTARLEALALAALTPLPPPAPGAAPETPADAPLRPQRVPTLDLQVAQLTVGDVALGQLAAVTSRVTDGQRIDTLRLDGGHLTAKASGFWLRSREAGIDGSSADLRFEVESDAIGDVLRVFGYAPNLSAERAMFSGALVWPRVPAGLELSQATGDIEVAVDNGSLKAVEPGAGRVLGLVNLYALPRRLLFDFRDVVADGLGFDQLKGRFKLADGNAVTDNLKIDGPSLKVEMRGRIGLAARDYDQKVTVYPDLSTGVTVGATLLGGPIAGGILLVAQQLFDKPFNQLGKFSYRVTGSWDDPIVNKGADDQHPAAAPETVGADNHG